MHRHLLCIICYLYYHSIASLSSSSFGCLRCARVQAPLIPPWSTDPLGAPFRSYLSPTTMNRSRGSSTAPLFAYIQFITALFLLIAINPSSAFNPSTGRINLGRIATSSLSSSTLSNSATDDQQSCDWNKVTEEWELDCYSRPVLVDGKKKLWEILVTDSSGHMKICRTLPSNK